MTDHDHEEAWDQLRHLEIGEDGTYEEGTLELWDGERVAVYTWEGPDGTIVAIAKQLRD